MDDLVTWLRAQLDDDERDSERVHYSLCSSVALRGPGHPCDCGFPQQRLAAVNAKRRILDVYRAEVIDVSVIPERPEWMHGRVPVEAHTVLRLLALPYADRPGYRNEWKP